MKGIKVFTICAGLIALIYSACDRDYRTVDATFNDTIKVDGKSNDQLQRKDPGNLKGTQDKGIQKEDEAEQGVLENTKGEPPKNNNDK